MRFRHLTFAIATAMSLSAGAALGLDFNAPGDSNTPSPRPTTPTSRKPTPPADQSATTDVGGLSVTTPGGVTQKLGEALGGRTVRVANRTALGLAAPALSPIMRDGYALAGDGGRATYTHSTTACAISGGDGGSQIPSAAGGCWLIDWASVGNVATPELFGARFAGGGSSAVDTPAVQAAMNTGKTVRIDVASPRSFNPNNCIKQTVRGQRIDGVSRLYPWIVLRNTLPADCKGVFVSTSGEPGPVIDNLGILFSQTVPTPAETVPAFYLVDTPRFILRTSGCYAASVCIDMKGNSGGALVQDFQMSALVTGIEVDGSLDTLRFIDLHGWPFRLQPELITYENLNVTWMKIARIDDLKVTGGLFFGGTPFNFYKSAKGHPTGEISGVDFDQSRCAMTFSSGTITIRGGYMALNQNCGNGPVVVDMVGPGSLTIMGTFIAMNNGAFPTDTPAIRISDPGARFVIANAASIDQQVDMPLMDVVAGTGIANANNITQQSWAPAGPSYRPKFKVGPKGRAIITSNMLNDVPTAGKVGVFAAVPTDGYTVIANNVAPGWSLTLPRTGGGTAGAYLGVYGPNANSASGHSAVR